MKNYCLIILKAQLFSYFHFYRHLIRDSTNSKTDITSDLFKWNFLKLQIVCFQEVSSKMSLSN